MKEECGRKGKWIGGCRFEPRYDTGAAEIEGVSFEGTGTGAFLDKLRKKTYVADICVTCGRRIDRLDTDR